MEISQSQFNIAVDQLLDETDREYETDFKGTKIKPNVKTFCWGMKAKVKQHYSQVIINSSMKKNGLGKSSLLYHQAIAIDKSNFSFERNFFFKGGLKDIEKKTARLPIGSILCMDELVRLWYSRQAMTRKVIDLNMWMAADQRKTEVILAGAIPDFYMLDSYARMGKVDYWIECLARGIGIIFKADHFPKTDPWHSEHFDRILKKRRKGGRESIVDKIGLLEKHPCFDGLIFWNKMPDDEEKEYKRLVNESVKETGESEIDKFKRDYDEKLGKTKYRAIEGLKNLIKLFEIRNVPKSRALKEAGLDTQTFNKMLKELEDHKKRIAQKKVMIGGAI